jgi:exonuclease SbcD
VTSTSASWRRRARRESKEALIAAGHLYVTGAHVSELSERQLFRGQQDALPLSVLPVEAAYVALGHLHRAQSVGVPHVRYSGSPIPLSITERDYVHEVVLVELEDERLVEARAIAVPRSVGVLRIPDRGTATMEQALAAIASLPEASSQPRERHPYLEIAIEVDEPTPGLRRILDEAVADRAARLLRTPVSVKARGLTATPFDAAPLRELLPQALFARLYEERFQTAVPQDLLDSFAELEAHVRIAKGGA